MIDLKNNDASELASGAGLDITATAEPGMTEEPPTFDVSGMRSYRVHLQYLIPEDPQLSGNAARLRSGTRLTVASVDFYQGSAHKEPPTVADVMHCVLLDASARHHGSFEDWAAEYGYDDDSRKAERIYERCLKTAEAAVDYFGEAVLCELEQLEH